MEISKNRLQRAKSVLITAWVKDDEARVEEFGEPISWIKVERSGSLAGIEKVDWIIKELEDEEWMVLMRFRHGDGGQ
ncbi:hypothetical protein A2U01_0046130 [Trifolium medium]|uniref:Uncharacterized protein n=1 Tax=Trifolium medium TaxID=97028 RepID=A0A392QKK1_9FABA|nr:hypothetical protein [Trifolium medium]